MALERIKEKLIITGTIKVVTGLHIGASNDFAPIGAVDSIVVRDPLTRAPIIPGSSLKGKMRSLLARVLTQNSFSAKIEEEPEDLKELFGYTTKEKTKAARILFSDCFLLERSRQELIKKGTDLYLTEVKFENTIDRLTSVANPRQIERVPSGALFGLHVVYNFVNNDMAKRDLALLSQGFALLQGDYLGGHGSRGYGRILFEDMDISPLGLAQEDINLQELKEILKGAEKGELLHLQA